MIRVTAIEGKRLCDSLEWMEPEGRGRYLCTLMAETICTTDQMLRLVAQASIDKHTESLNGLFLVLLYLRDRYNEIVEAISKFLGVDAVEGTLTAMRMNKRVSVAHNVLLMTDSEWEEGTGADRIVEFIKDYAASKR